MMILHKTSRTVMTEERVTSTDPKPVLLQSALYREFLAEREEILRHKWIESEKAGYDIGFERALLDWIVKYRSIWRKHRRETNASAEQLHPSASNGRADDNQTKVNFG
jgi:hypothetical protein